MAKVTSCEFLEGEAGDVMGVGFTVNALLDTGLTESSSIKCNGYESRQTFLDWTVQKVQSLDSKTRATTSTLTTSSPYFSSGIVELAKRERARRGVAPFSRAVIFARARVSLALLSLRKNGGCL